MMLLITPRMMVAKIVIKRKFLHLILQSRNFFCIPMQKQAFGNKYNITLLPKDIVVTIEIPAHP